MRRLEKAQMRSLNATHEKMSRFFAHLKLGARQAVAVHQDPKELCELLQLRCRLGVFL